LVIDNQAYALEATCPDILGCDVLPTLRMLGLVE
jgi:hypothetical protein